MKRAAAVALLLVGSAACKAPYMARPSVAEGGTIYQGSVGPLSYQAPTPADVTPPAPVREVTAEACQQAIVIPIPIGGVTTPSDPASAGLTPIGVAWGDGGVARAMASAARDAGDGVLYDVRVDRHFFTVLWVYRRDCVEVHASVAAPRR
jgi:hypothetical protein